MQRLTIIFLILSVVFFVIGSILLKDYSMVPIHYNIFGEVNSEGSKYIILLLYFMPPLLSFLMISLKKSAFSQEESKDHLKYLNMTLIIVAIFIYVLITCIIISIIKDLNIINITKYLIGITLIVLGIRFRKIKQNKFIGIRTKNTLSDEKKWKVVHNFAMILFAEAGILFILIPYEYIAISFLILICNIIAIIVVANTKRR